MYSRGSTKIKHKELKGKKKMRVTKLIREYVEQTVNEIYDPIIQDCFEDYQERKSEVEDILEKMTEEFDTAAKKMIKEHGFTIDDSLSRGERTIINYACNFGAKEHMSIRTEANKIRDEKKQKIQEILVNLELGGTKAELDEMLRALRDTKEEVAV